MTPRHATPLTPRGFVVRLAGAAGILLLLLALSPGIGTESASFGWWDAWRSRLGIAIPAGELIGRPLVDRDGDGRISDEERDGFAELARTIGFGQRFARSLLALQVGVTLALCGATFQVLFRNPLADPALLGLARIGTARSIEALKRVEATGSTAERRRAARPRPWPAHGAGSGATRRRASGLRV